MSAPKFRRIPQTSSSYGFHLIKNEDDERTPLEAALCNDATAEMDKDELEDDEKWATTKTYAEAMQAFEKGSCDE